ncbi:nucleotidyltransferase domain-containing protein [Aphanothece sacrum]|uniref:DNA polymerase beta domain-containing protein region n=1 Tax=Aphanothece sacrum FPU1 TaxID=1920663 RepID=A0A401IK97_APHSA|nr:nucleotidyltransferase domain-containing protein [Aphanothece sacrum]GBF81679.1 DNA polymerase beta domain-containing protein region [Aphanothece sacrum FPU1]GBF84062.1 DNA polymerase beta domain-containing protein [Aphanothece sacrum FPU3]
MDTSLIQNLSFSKQHPHLPEILEKFKQQIKNIYQEQLVKLILFGSQAKRQAKPESDIDILVILKDKLINDEQHQEIINLISDLCLEYEVLISCVYVSEAQFNQEKSPLLLNIEREGIIL